MHSYKHRWEYRVYDDDGKYYGKVWTNNDFRRWVAERIDGSSTQTHYSRTTATTWLLANSTPIDWLNMKPKEVEKKTP